MTEDEMIAELVVRLNADLAAVGHTVALERGTHRRLPHLEPDDGVARLEGIWILKDGQAPDGYHWAGGGEMDEMVEISIDGSTIGGVGGGQGQDTVGNVLDHVQDYMVERLHFGEPWPPCPVHPNHPLNPGWGDDLWFWVCEVDGVRIVLGGLNKP